MFKILQKRLSAEAQLDIIEKKLLSTSTSTNESSNSSLSQRNLSSLTSTTTSALLAATASLRGGSVQHQVSVIPWGGIVKEDPKTSPLLLFLKKRGEKRMAERKAKRFVMSCLLKKKCSYTYICCT